VKHPLPRELRDELSRGLDCLGRSISTEAADSCLDFLLRVLRANKSVNLTGISDPRSAVRLHLLDSLTAMPEIETSAEGPILDLGSGGGFPGVPLCVASGRRTVLLDSVAKKTAAVARIIDECGIEGASTICGRAEEVAGGEKNVFAVVVARAVAPLPVLIELAAPFLGVQGRLVALKGRISAEEVSSGDSAAAIAGLKSAGRRDLVLPGGEERRTILVYEKEGPGLVDLPRRTGLAQKRPLG
jgi:16S rRNA (guanine527-N7)-methyltransferase